MEEIEFWGYLHTNGNIQVKRWLGDGLVLEDAQHSPFVKEIFYPFPCPNMEMAYNYILKNYIGYGVLS